MGTYTRKGLTGEGVCSKCGKTRIIVNKRHYLCQECNYVRLHGHAPGRKPIGYKRFNEKFAYCVKWGFSSEKSLFEHVFDSRPHVSQVSGKPIHDARPHNFAHILPKAINKYPHLRFCPWNIALMTLMEHHLWDNGTDDQRRDYAKRIGNPDCWIPIEEQRDGLKEYYKGGFWLDGTRDKFSK